MDDSLIKQTLGKQYSAALNMLGQAIDHCPDELWLSNAFKNPSWHIAYHAVFYTHFYLQPAEADFQPWNKHVPDSQYLGPRPWAKDQPFERPAPYPKPDVVEYLNHCRAELSRLLPQLSLEGESGFPWLEFPKFDLLLYNLRHLEHHTGQLIERLRASADIGIGWVREA